LYVCAPPLSVCHFRSYPLCFLLGKQDPLKFLIALFEHVSRDFLKLCDDDRLFQSTDGSYEFIVSAVFFLQHMRQCLTLSLCCVSGSGKIVGQTGFPSLAYCKQSELVLQVRRFFLCSV